MTHFNILKITKFLAFENAPSSSNGPIPTSTSQTAIAPAPVGAVYDAPPLEKSDSRGSVRSPQQTAGSAVTSPTKASSPENVLGLATSLYQWKARNDSELSFAKGEQIEILEQGEMRWRGRLQKKPDTQGWFPKSYVKMNAPGKICAFLRCKDRKMFYYL